MAAPRSWSAEDDQILGKLHARGSSLREIAREMGWSKDAVGRHARLLGLAFDGAITEAATKVAVADAKARQAQLKLDLLGDLEQARLLITRAQNPRDFQQIGMGFAAVMRSYTDFVRTLPPETGIEAAQSMLGRILGAIDASLQGVEPLNPIGAGEAQQ